MSHCIIVIIAIRSETYSSIISSLIVCSSAKSSYAYSAFSMVSGISPNASRICFRLSLTRFAAWKLVRPAIPRRLRFIGAYPKDQEQAGTDWGRIVSLRYEPQEWVDRGSIISDHSGNLSRYTPPSFFLFHVLFLRIFVFSHDLVPAVSTTDLEILKGLVLGWGSINIQCFEKMVRMILDNIDPMGVGTLGPFSCGNP